MKKSIITLVGSCLLAVVAEAGVRVYVQDTNGVAWIKYECTAGELIRAFALNVTVDRGQITGISNFFTGPNSTTARGYGIFPAAFRDHVAVTVTSGTSANWSASGYNPVASVTDAPTDTLGGLGTNGVTLEFGALWNPALPAAAPASSGTLCALQLSQGAVVTVAANASRGGVVASPDGNVVAPTFAGAAVGPLPEIAVEQPAGTDLADGGARDFGTAAVGSNTSLDFTIRNTGSANLTGLVITKKDGSNPDDFTVTSSPVAPVSGPSGSTTFTVTFAPAAAGACSAVIHIANNDIDENPFDITLTGQGNRAPVFPGYALTGMTGQQLSIYPAKILARASDPDGDAINLTRVFSPSARGGTVVLTDTVNYTPDSGFVGTDTFEVELTDARGANMRGIITITVTVAATGEARNQTSFAIIDGKPVVVFRGIPERSYLIQRSSNLTDWSDLATVIAGSDGKITFIDDSPPEKQGFYRTHSN